MGSFPTRQLLFILTLCLCYGFSFAQDTVEPQISGRSTLVEKAKEDIESLKKGVLVFRLQSHNRKLIYLDKARNNQTLNAKNKNRLDRQYQETIQMKEKDAREFYDSFKEGVTFTDVYFIYDTAAIALKKGARQGIFLNKELKIDPSISVAGKSVYVIGLGVTDRSSSSGVEALLMMDQTLEPLEKPFPYSVKLKNMGHIFQTIFQPSKGPYRKSGAKLAAKLNKQLWDFYDRQPRSRS